MMSISRGMLAGHASGYFAREDYYQQEPGAGENSRWVGDGARELHLEGGVEKEAFHALCNGADAAGKQLVAPRLVRDPESGALTEVHRAGFDCTFSAPKSISIANAAGVAGIKEAHDRAVLSVLQHLEEQGYGQYRTPEGISSGKLVIAKFDHGTSRNIDPQLHSHCFILNMVGTEDGNWRALEPKAIFQDQRSLGLLYRQALIYELEAGGFRVDIQDRSQLYFELHGVDPGLVQHFSSRREEIERQVGTWLTEGKFVGVPHARLYEMAALETRDPKREMTWEDAGRIFERGFETCGTSSELVKQHLERERDHALARVPSEPESASRVVQLAVRDLTEREAVLHRADLLDQAVRISGGRHRVPELNAAIDGGAEGLVDLGRDGRGRQCYTTVGMLELERGNLERIRELQPFKSLTSAPEVEGFLDRQDVRLTAGQRMEVVNELAGKRGCTLTLGDPGTRKTRTLELVERFNEEVLRPSGREHLSINLAYTGKAARELSLATGRPAFTVDSFTNAWSASKFALQKEIGTPAIVEVGHEKVIIHNGVQVALRVDEASFLGARQARRLLEVVDDLRSRDIEVKLHLIGDSKQMQAISAGDLLKQVRGLGENREVDFAHLDEILRQRDPELLEIARGLNREDRPLSVNAREALLILDHGGRVVEHAARGELVRAARDRYLAESREPSRLPERAARGAQQEVLLVTTTNTERKELNREIRAARVLAGEIEQGRSFSVLTPVRQGITVEGYQPGDTVVFSGTRREDGQMERWGARLNTEGKVVGIDRERNTVEIEYSFHTKKHDGRELTRTVHKEYSAAEMAGRTSLYREEERNFSVGDRIVALKNDHRLGLQNGDLGRVRELDVRGVALVDFGDRKAAIDLKKYRQVDHAYAVTIHKSQGVTVEHSIMFAMVQPERKREKELDLTASEPYGRASYNALNVAVTRAQFGTHVFTNSIEGLARSVEQVDEKSSTLKRTPAQERDLAPEVPGRIFSTAENIHHLGRKLGELERVSHGPMKGPSLTPGVAPVRDIARELTESLNRLAQVQHVPVKELSLPLPSRGRELSLSR